MKLPTHSDIIRERWQRGNLRYKVHAGQQLILDKLARKTGQLFVGECARQFGKTFLEVLLAVEKARKKKNARIKIGTAFHTDLVEFILPAFEAVMSDCPNGLRLKYVGYKSKFIDEVTGSEIKLIGLDRKPNGMRGNQIDLMILDEAAFMMGLSYLYKSVIMPATTHRPDCDVILFSTPPKEPGHEFLDFVAKAKMEDAHCLLTIYDNPMVDAKTIERLMRESGGAESITWRREYLCEHVTDTNLTLLPEWKSDYVQAVEKDLFYPCYHKYISMDLGVSDFTAAIFGYYDFQRAKLIIEDEFFMNGPTLTTLSIKKAIEDKTTQLWDNMPVFRKISDNNNPLLLQDLSFIHQLHFLPTNKASLDEMLNQLRLLVAEGAILIHPKCKQLIGCMEFGVWNKKRTEFGRSDIFGHYDALAALVYLVRNLNRSINPIPTDYLMDGMNQVLVGRGETRMNSSFKAAFGLKR